MDFVKYISLLVIFYFDSIESGGHGGGSHDHIKLYVPEIHHHKHHTKYVTIHHHHKKPKKETHHHHHHHHHQKPHIPHHHFGYHHTKKGHKTEIKTTTTNHGHGHKHHGHKHHGHKHHVPKHHVTKHHVTKHHGHHHDPPDTFDDDYSYSPPVIPSVPQYSPIPHFPSIPKVQGMTHTVKKVNVFDSLPGAIPGGSGGVGYEVTENSDKDEDYFSSVNDLHDIYPSTYDFVRSAQGTSNQHPFSSVPSQTPFSSVPAQSPFSSVPAQSPFSSVPSQSSFSSVPSQSSFSSVPSQTHDPFAQSQEDDFSGNVGQQEAFIPLPPNDIPVSFDGSNHESFGDNENAFVAPAGGNDIYSVADEKFTDDETPVSFSREAGIQQTYSSSAEKTFVYK